MAFINTQEATSINKDGKWFVVCVEDSCENLREVDKFNRRKVLRCTGCQYKRKRKYNSDYKKRQRAGARREKANNQIGGVLRAPQI